MGATLTILVVDDQPALADAVADLLRLDGHEVLTAANGRDALAIAQPGRFHLVLSDVRMPVMGGEALCQALRARGGPPFWFALMSSLSESTARPQVAGVNAFLAKPFHPGQLCDLVAACRADPRIDARLTGGCDPAG